MNNFLNCTTFLDEPEPDVTLDFMLTFRMRPTPVRLRLFTAPTSGSALFWCSFKAEEWLCIGLRCKRNTPQCWTFFMCLIGVPKLAGDGWAEMLNPHAAQLLLPLGLSLISSDFFEVM